MSASPYRLQFAIASRLAPPSGWNTIDLGEPGVLGYQSELPVVDITRSAHRLILLGDILDWANPEQDNARIVERIAAGTDSLDTVINATREFGGRWALLRIADGEADLFHDATGMRAVCHAMDSAHRVAVASDQGMLARIAGLDPCPEARSFVDGFSRRVSQWWLPGDGLLFRNARQLLPNHRLSLRTGEVKRYWGGEPDPDGSTEERLSRVATRISGSIRSASQRYPLAVGLSAGWDSRLILASCRDIRNEIRAYSTAPRSQAGTAVDVKLPERICRENHIRHDVLVPSESPSAAFRSAFGEHVFRPHPEFTAYMESELNYSRGEIAGVTGNIAEIVKNPYAGKIGTEGFDDRDPAQLSRLVRMQGFSYAESAIARWRDQAVTQGSLSIPQLFFWENRCGRWLSRNVLMFDIGWREIVMPLNCRALLVDMLAVPISLRQRPECLAFERMIKAQWPELLATPIVSKEKTSRPKRLLTDARQTLRRVMRSRPRRAD